MIDKTNPIKGRNGGTLYPPKKGDKRGRLGGRKKQPRKLKDFIKQMETEDSELILPAEKVEVIEKNGQKYIKFKGFQAGKLFASLLQQSMKGNMRALDILIKMGFGGGYEPVRTDNKNTHTIESDLTNLTDEQLEALKSIHTKNDNT